MTNINVTQVAQQAAKSVPQLKHLENFVGKWNTEGMTNDGRIVPIHAFDTYEWLPGGFFLIHHIEARIGDDEYKSIEVIGYDPETQTYPMRFYDSWGGTGTYQATIEGDTWKYTGESSRATVVVSDDGNTMTAAWEMSDNGSNWHPWMDVKLTRAE